MDNQITTFAYVLVSVFWRFLVRDTNMYYYMSLCGCYRHKVLKFTPSVGQFQKLSKFENAPGFDFWKTPRQPGDNMDVMVAPEHYGTFKRFLEKNKIDYKILFDNVQE